MYMRKTIFIGLAVFAVSAFMMMSAESAMAANCGGTVLCSCGDTVVTGHTLTTADPVTQSTCTGRGLIISSTSGINVFCSTGITITGIGASAAGAGVGIEITGSNNYVEACSVTGFDKGYYITGANNYVTSGAFQWPVQSPSSANYNNIGFHITGTTATGNKLEGIVADNNTSYGVLIDGGSANTSMVPWVHPGAAPGTAFPYLTPRIRNNGASGVVVNNSNSNKLYGFETRGNAANGILIDSSDFNQLADFAFIGQAPNYVMFISSQVTNNIASGILINNNSRYNVISGNTYVSGNVDGISIYSPNNTLLQAIVRGNSRYGVVLGQQANTTLMGLYPTSKVFIFANGQGGALLYSDNNLVDYVQSIRSAGFGMKLDGSDNNTIRHLQILLSSSNGLELINSTGNQIDGFESRLNGGHGAYLSSSSGNTLVLPTLTPNLPPMGIPGKLLFLPITMDLYRKI